MGWETCIFFRHLHIRNASFDQLSNSDSSLGATGKQMDILTYTYTQTDKHIILFLFRVVVERHP